MVLQEDEGGVASSSVPVATVDVRKQNRGKTNDADLPFHDLVEMHAGSVEDQEGAIGVDFHKIAWTSDSVLIQ